MSAPPSSTNFVRARSEPFQPSTHTVASETVTTSNTVLTRRKGMLAIEDEVEKQAHERGAARHKKRKIAKDPEEYFDPQDQGAEPEHDRYMVVIHKGNGRQFLLPRSDIGLAKLFSVETRINARLLKEQISHEAWGTNVSQDELASLDFMACHSLFPELVTKELDVRNLPLPKEDLARQTELEKRLELFRLMRKASDRMITKLESYLDAKSRPSSKRRIRNPTDPEVPVRSEIFKLMIESTTMQPVEVTAMADTWYRMQASLGEYYRRGLSVLATHARQEQSVSDTKMADLMSLMSVVQNQVGNAVSDIVDPTEIIRLLGTEYHVCACATCQPRPGTGLSKAHQLKLVTQQEAKDLADQTEDTKAQMANGVGLENNDAMIVDGTDQSKLKTKIITRALDKLQDVLLSLEGLDQETRAWLRHYIDVYDQVTYQEARVKESTNLALFLENEVEYSLIPRPPATKLDFEKMIADFIDIDAKHTYLMENRRYSMEQDHPCYAAARQIADGHMDPAQLVNYVVNQDMLFNLTPEERQILEDSRGKWMAISEEFALADPAKYMSPREEAVWFKAKGEAEPIKLTFSMASDGSGDVYTQGRQAIVAVLSRAPEHESWPDSHEYITESANSIRGRSVKALEIEADLFHSMLAQEMGDDPTFRIQEWWNKTFEDTPNSAERGNMSAKRRKMLDDLLGKNDADPDDADSEDDEETARQKAARRKAKIRQSGGSAPLSHAHSVWQRMETYPKEILTSTGEYFMEGGKPRYRFNGNWDLVNEFGEAIQRTNSADLYIITRMRISNAIVQVGDSFMKELAEFRVTVAKAGLKIRKEEVPSDETRIGNAENDLTCRIQQRERCLKLLDLTDEQLAAEVKAWNEANALADTFQIQFP